MGQGLWDTDTTWGCEHSCWGGGLGVGDTEGAGMKNQMSGTRSCRKPSACLEVGRGSAHCWSLQSCVGFIVWFDAAWKSEQVADPTPEHELSSPPLCSQVLSPLAKNLFHRAISESGVALTAVLVKKGDVKPLAEVGLPLDTPTPFTLCS